MHDELSEVFPDALKQSIKYAAKAVKKDAKTRNKKDDDRPEEDDAGFYTDGNQEMLNEIIKTGAEGAEYYAIEGEYSKAASAFNKLLKINTEDANLKFAVGANQVLSRNLGEGQRNIDMAMELMKTNYVENEITMPALEMAFIAYTNYLIENGETDKAKEVAQVIYESVPANDKIDAQYNRIK